MKAFTYVDLKELAQKHGAGLSIIQDGAIHKTAILDLLTCQFESTEYYNYEFSGFKFVGEIKAQDDHLGLINELNGEVNNPESNLLTIELAKELVGKTVEFEYKANMKCKFRIVRLERREQRQIGQGSHYVLIVNNCQALAYHDDNTVTWSDPEEEETSYPYEWQGIFRVTGSASPLRVYKL